MSFFLRKPNALSPVSFAILNVPNNGVARLAFVDPIHPLNSRIIAAITELLTLGSALGSTKLYLLTNGHHSRLCRRPDIPVLLGLFGLHELAVMAEKKVLLGVS